MSQFITVKVFTDELEAAMAKNLLDTSGIPTRLQSDNAGGVMPHLSFSNGIKLMVPAANLEKAQDLLNY